MEGTVLKIQFNKTMFILTPLLLLKQQEVDFVQMLMMEGNES